MSPSSRIISSWCFNNGVSIPTRRSKNKKNSQHFWRKQKTHTVFALSVCTGFISNNPWCQRIFFPVNADPTTREAIRLDFFQAEAFLMRAKVRSRQKAQEDLKARLVASLGFREPVGCIRLKGREGEKKSHGSCWRLCFQRKSVKIVDRTAKFGSFSYILQIV